MNSAAGVGDAAEGVRDVKEGSEEKYKLQNYAQNFSDRR
jgi:hypothetical protein